MDIKDLLEGTEGDRRLFLGQMLGLAVSGIGLQALAPHVHAQESPDAPPGETLFDPEEEDLFGSLDLGMTGNAEEIAARVHKSLPFLKLDPSGVAKFAHELVAAREKGDMKPIYWLDLAHRYLLSSDFFDNGADLAKPVKFVLFYEPYLTPCFNPFASPPPDPIE